MRVLELEIYNARGITGLSLKPNGKNFVVWGPNGSGKSAVVDAIDFLLTGRISRLTGKGTGGITLNKHGPHIDHKSEEAVIRAKVQLPGLKKPVEIERCMADPNTLKCGEGVKQHLEPIMALARRGQHVLTRREILKYFTAEAGTRAQEIQELLNISEIEEIRKTLVKVDNEFERECQGAKRAVQTAKSSINATVQQRTFSEDIVLRVVNQNRAVLGGQPVSALCASGLKTGLTPPTVVTHAQAINVTLLEKDIQNLRNLTLAQNEAQIAKIDKQLRDSITTIRSNPQLLRELSRLELTNLGMRLMDETGSCPLCDTKWPAWKLREYLEQRLSTAQVATQHRERVTKLSDTIANTVNSTIASLRKVIGAAQAVDFKDKLPMLQSWLSNLQDLLSLLHKD